MGTFIGRQGPVIVITTRLGLFKLILATLFLVPCSSPRNQAARDEDADDEGGAEVPRRLHKVKKKF